MKRLEEMADTVRKVAIEMMNTSMQDIDASIICGWGTVLADVADHFRDPTKMMNAAEMLTALEAIRDSAKDGSISTLPTASLVLKTCENALSAPPRNCDRYDTADEFMEDFADRALLEEWKKWRESNFTTPLQEGFYCIDWLFNRAKGEQK